MSKKELTKKLMNRMQKFGYFPTFTNVKTFIKEYEKLAKPEPQKPVVQQFVADWYEEHKGDFDLDLWDVIYEHGRGNATAMSTWIDVTDDALITLVNMHQFGYEVEKEKRYLVKIKSTGQCLGKYYINNETLSPRFIYTGRNADGFTRKELEDAGFGEVFNSPLFEVEEVKDDFKI
nr:MAG TPA: Protein of unknown function (DUF1642) [Caudoviricetes sp.]